ncbi:hypothetical protein M752DRAFT_262283 [Aspergillus phoenicis ATCC 13157]|uniref:Uncharacterized protein n=1 Tax=Aspergillus phoenicis ATCC 13157 TaxID=1353007 RepID=A0A370PYU3_ASPPH|nr:hypothetical protein M752DRAFT_262283 [Aspergillus phoenicis ATCC 13157]
MHASAQVLIPEDTGLTDATCIKRLLESQDLWVSHAPELKLYISISVGASMALSASSFSSQIGEMLCSSKLWSDLGLVALFKSCNHFHYSDLTSFELIIGIRRNLKQSSKTKSARKTALFDHLDDVQTPVHIQTVNLSTVNAFMSFTSKTESAQLYILDTDSLTKPNLVGDYYYKNYILKHTQDTIFFGPQQSVYKESSEDTQVTSFVDELEELHESEQVSSLLTPQEGFFERASPAGQHEQLYDLFKVGLESLLFGRTSSTNHSDLQNKTLQPLSQIAPSVFSPNYHKKQLYKPQASRNLRFQTPSPNIQCKDQPSQIGERVSRDLIYSSDGEEELLRFSEPDEDSSCAMLSTTTAAAPSSSCGSLPFSQDDCEDENDDIMSDRFSGNDMDHTLFSDDMAEFEEFGDDNDDDDMLCGSF